MKMLSSIRDMLLNALAFIGAVAILMLMLHVVSDVVLRNALNSPIPATYEVVTNYYMVALAFIPLAWVERKGGMIQVEVLDSVMPQLLITLSDVLVALLSTVVYSALAWFTLKTAMTNFATGTFVLAQNVPLPTWPAYFLPPLGFLLAALISVTRVFYPASGSDSGSVE